MACLHGAVDLLAWAVHTYAGGYNQKKPQYSGAHAVPATQYREAVTMYFQVIDQELWDFTMGSSYYNIVAAVLLVMNFERTRSMQDSCSKCPAGTFCGKNKGQICLPCPPNSFSSTSGQTACDICRQCEGVFRTKKVCSPISNAECECISGFHCLGAGCTMCEPDCKQGQELTKEGSCSLGGKSVLVNGTKESDAVCGPASADFSPGTASAPTPAPARDPGHTPQIIIFLALTSAAVLLLVFFLVLCFSVLKHGRKKLLYLFKQ
ncbi:hypothetical protein GH733_015871, partial [Mirounga leonina]